MRVRVENIGDVLDVFVFRIDSYLATSNQSIGRRDLV